MSNVDKQPEVKAKNGAVPPGIPREKIRDEKLARMLTDEEILRMYEAEDANIFEFDKKIVPAGWTYEWKLHECFGMDNKKYLAELQRHNWVPVNAEDHPGYFMPESYTGHVLRQGLALYKMETQEYLWRKRYDQLKAERQVQEQERVLGIAPIGTGPRIHPRVRPSINVNYEAIDVE